MNPLQRRTTEHATIGMLTMSKDRQANHRAGGRWALLLAGLARSGPLAYRHFRFRGGRSNPASTTSQLQAVPQPDASLAAGSAGQVNTDRPNADLGTLRRPTRVCAGLRVFDIQVGSGNQIEGAWLATPDSPSPVLVAVGQRFGSGF